ncbi:hypothetical protein I4Q36_06245 [Tuanshanicoccus lijuaniae]|uniref:hypothetical protein n=1 Tax=Aerococcaceae bacterium zg-1292 TaxID=2774330 RepID=UPI0019385B2E|nr:hypothetical protein [Aerococcaceae bacterium zg-1292]QQA36419.1 hypothetical protein I4Q36_06245 [Aerococcaceae bacterium zg-1292]
MRRISLLIGIIIFGTGCQAVGNVANLPVETQAVTTKALTESTLVHALQRYTALEINSWTTGLTKQQVALKDILSSMKTIDAVEYIVEVETLGAGRYQLVRIFENYRDGLVLIKQFRYDTATQKINEIKIEKEVNN